MEGAILGYVVQKLGDFLLQEISLLRETEEDFFSETEEDLEWMKSELEMMQAFMDQHALTNEISDRRVKTWVQDVQKLAFQAENIIDSFTSSTQRYISIGSFGFFIGGTSPSLSARRKFGVKVGKLRERVKQLTRRKETYWSEPCSMEPPKRENGLQLSEIRRKKAERPIQDTDVVVGLESHVKDVMERLQRGEMQRSVLSIVGMGGLGKTTLAKKVYQETKECSTFDCTAWVVTSQDYNSLELLRTIAKEVMGIPSKDLREMDKDELEKILRQFLCHNRYLIVLDDVWETQVLDDFFGTSPDPGNGSRMIITTRFLDVGRSADHGDFQPYELPFLGEEAAWELFAKKAFPYEQNPEKCFTDELKKLGKEMVAKCNGLPLAIVVLGGLLSSRDKSHYAWSLIADGTQWNEPRMEDECMRILALSYQALPVHMRCCFLYLGIFPKDAVIDVPKLLRLWIAEGFVINADGEDLEETAERYVEELIQRCLVQVVRRNSYGGVVKIRVHDLLVELAIREAKCGRFLEVWGNKEGENFASNARCLVVAKSSPKHFPFHRNLRSLFLREEVVPHSLHLKNFNLLRVLDVYRNYHYSLPKEVGLLVNLRYLRVAWSNSCTFLSSLWKLKHLQTLEIFRMGSLIFPSSLWQIKTLRHVIGNYFKVSSKAPIGDNILPNLRTLRGIIAGPWIKNILPRLNNLRQLYVRDIDEEWMAKSMSSAIENLQQLNVLELEGDYILEMEQNFLSDNTHRHLYELAIERCRRRRLNNWNCHGLPQNLSRVQLRGVYIQSNILNLLGSLQSLKELILFDTSFEEEEDMAFEGGSFPQLRVLMLNDLKIKRWALELPCLDNLTDLEIRNCRDLEALPEGLQHIPALACLKLWLMGSEFVERNRGILDELHCQKYI